MVVLNPEERLAQAKSQVGFINLFTQPLFDAVAAVCPAFAFFSEKCKEGREVWERVVLEGEETCSRPQTAEGRREETSGGGLAPVIEMSPLTTPKQPSSASFTPPDSGSSPALPPSKSFSSRLPPHRAPRSLKQIDASRANAFSAAQSQHHLLRQHDEHGRLSSIASATSSSTASTAMSGYSSSPHSPSGASTLFDRSASMSSTASSVFPSMGIEDCVELGDETCTGNCSSITASCVSCQQKDLQALQQQGQQDAAEPSTLR